MRVIIAGSRGIFDLQVIEDAVKLAKDLHNIVPTVVISGTAKGVDKLGEMYARNNDIPVEQFPADWDRFGKSAGYKRNGVMANNADALIAVWDGTSKGTGHMIDIAKTKKLAIYIHRT